MDTALEKPTTTLMEFVLGELRTNPELTFAELKARANLHRIKVYPVSYGRAKALLGLVPTRPRAPRKPKESERPSAAAAPAAPTPTPARAAGRPMGARMQWLLQRLQATPDTGFPDLRAAAAAAGFVVTPQIVSLAKGRLGLRQRRGSRPPRAESAPAATASQAFDLDSLVATIREIEAERNRLRAALTQIAAILAALD